MSGARGCWRRRRKWPWDSDSTKLLVYAVASTYKRSSEFTSGSIRFVYSWSHNGVTAKKLCRSTPSVTNSDILSGSGMMCNFLQ